jgi:hypothetical protein
VNDRLSRSGPTRNYTEPSDDPNMDKNSEEESDKDSGDMQQGYLCNSADPSRLAREEVRPSFSTPGNCGRTSHSNRTQKIKR